MTQHETYDGRPELITAPATRFPSGEIVTYWAGPPPGRSLRYAERAPQYRRAERLLAVGLGHIRDKPARPEVARRCFHAAVCLLAWALGADRRLAFAWDRLGYAHHLIGNEDEAEACYLRSLAIQGGSGQAFTSWNEVTQLNLAIIYGRSGRGALNRAVLEGYDPKAPSYLPGAREADAEPAAPPSRSPERPRRDDTLDPREER